MPTLLLVSTEADTSAHFFTEVDGWDVVTLYYGQTSPANMQAEAVYFRDPFNRADYNISAINATLLAVRENLPGAYYIDHITSPDDLLFEDKWHQYTLMPELFPRTQLLLNSSDIAPTTLAKKRISCRARDIAFEPSDISGPLEDYILQERMEILQELRVYVVGGEVLPKGTVKHSKTEQTKAKIMHATALTNDVRDFAQHVGSFVDQLDFYGLDIALTERGLRLIEVNRSPQFGRYNQLAQINLAAELLSYLEGNKVKR